MEENRFRKHFIIKLYWTKFQTEGLKFIKNTDNTGWTWVIRLVSQIEKLGGKALLFWNMIDIFVFFTIVNLIENKKNENLKVGSWQRCENKLCREKGLEELREISVEVTAESLRMIGCPNKRDGST